MVNVRLITQMTGGGGNRTDAARALSLRLPPHLDAG